MNFEYLQEFLVLAQTLNLSQASKKLYITPATLSRHIRLLEQDLGVSLVLITTHYIALTPAGELFVEDAQHLVRRWEDTLKRLKFDSVSVRGTCRILASRSAMSPGLTDFLVFFKKKYPEIRLIIDILSDELVIAHRDEYNITFSLFSLDSSEQYTSNQLQTSDGCLVIPIEESFQNPYKVYLNELSGKTLLLPWLEYADSPFARIGNTVIEKTRHHVNLNNSQSIGSALLNVNFGLGMTILPTYLSEMKYDNSRIIQIADRQITFSVFSYYNHSLETDAANLFLRELKDSFKN